MKQIQVYTALAFLTLLLVVVGGVWVFSSLLGGSDGATNGDRGFFGSLFPFGRGGGTTILDPTKDALEPGGPVPRLRKVTDAPVAGATFATGITGLPSVRYVERETGHMYETPLDAVTVIRLTNTTVPAVRDARFLNASTTLMRFLSETGTIENFLGSVTTTSTDATLQGTFLEPFARTTFSGSALIGILETPDGSALKSVSLDGITARSVFSSPIGSWVPHAAGGKVFVSSAPSGRAAGALYEVANGKLERLMGGIRGLEVLPHPSAASFLVSSGAENAVSLYLLDGASGVLGTLPRATSVSKCSWIGVSRQAVCAFPKTLPGGLYPDDWLLGRVHTTDDLWIVDTETGTLTVALDLEAESGVRIDAADLRASDDGRFVLLRNRNDQGLWVASLTTPQ